MTDLAWMKTYIGTETALTGHLTAEEFGAYERLRRHYWQHGNLPPDEPRLMRISGVDPERWESIKQAIGPLLAEGLPRLDDERSEASVKRERKVAAGRKGAEARWQIDGRTNANANGIPMATASDKMANASFCQWPSASASASASEEEGLGEKEDKLVQGGSTQDPPPRITDKVKAGQWLGDHGIYPMDPQFDACVAKMLVGLLTWNDIERAAV